MKRLLVGCCVVVALLAPEAADAANECDGLDVCISVPGPFVALPGARAGGATTVSYRLSCPRGTIAAGTDAVRGDEGVDVTFLGTLGSPVSPGRTTSRDVWFLAVWPGARATTFRPYLGCVPVSGGGGRSTTAVAARAPAPVPRFVRRVKNVRVRVGATATLSCRSGERLVGGSHAVGFRTRTAPVQGWLGAVRVTMSRRGDSLVLRARRGEAIPPRVRVAVQMQALCARRG